MADIELVIKMPESIWVTIQNGEYCGILDDRTYNAIKNGTPLPKGHGVIKDISQIEIPMCEDRAYETWVQVAINAAPTIIEADKAGEEE